MNLKRPRPVRVIQVNPSKIRKIRTIISKPAKVIPLRQPARVIPVKSRKK